MTYRHYYERGVQHGEPLQIDTIGIVAETDGPGWESPAAIIALIMAANSDICVGLIGCGKSLSEKLAIELHPEVDNLHNWRQGEVEVYARRYHKGRKPDVIISVNDWDFELRRRYGINNN